MSEVKRKLNLHVVEDDTDTVEVGALFKTEQKQKQKEKKRQENENEEENDIRRKSCRIRKRESFESFVCEERPIIVK